MIGNLQLWSKETDTFCDIVTSKLRKNLNIWTFALFVLSFFI